MLPPEYLDILPDTVLDYFHEAETRIIQDIARRISKEGYVTESAADQLERLRRLGAEHDYILAELEKATGRAQADLIGAFDDAAKTTLGFDDKIYKAVGYSPIPLVDNPYMQQLIKAGLAKTNQIFKNLTKTTAQTATQQFERFLDDAYMDITTGGFGYQQAIKRGIYQLAEKGIATITYPSGHTDYLDVAFRRATLTGVNQTACKIQEQRMAEMGTELVETTAHAGARPSHAEWQGRIFSYNGSSSKYPNFEQATGYGTGAGLGGWNCRHSFFPFFEGLSGRAYTDAQLRGYANDTLIYNNKPISYYKATQKQRYYERQIRKWKRIYAGLDAAGQDTAEARAAIRKQQAKQRDFIEQTGFRRDYYRERAGKQVKG